MTARWLNALCGCTTYNLENVDDLPEVTVRQLRAIEERIADGKQST